MADENLENLEQTDDGRHSDSDGIGTDAGTGTGIDAGDRADDRPTGDGDGTLDGGSVGTVGTGGTDGDESGDSGGSGASGLDGELRDTLGTLGTFGKAGQSVGDGEQPHKRRGRPRKRDRGSDIAGDSGTGTASGSQNAARPKLVDLGNEREPKKVPDSIFEKDSDLSKLTKNQAVEMIAGVLQGLFFVPAQALGHKHWILTDKEAVELAKAIYDCLGTLPTKQSKKVDKFLKEYAPLVKLAIVGGSITLSRVSLSVQMRQQAKNERIAADTNRIVNPGTTAGNGFPAGPSDDFVIG